MKMQARKIFFITVIIAALLFASVPACFAAADDSFICVSRDRTEGKYAFNVHRVANAYTGQLVNSTEVTFTYKIEFETDTNEIIKVVEGSGRIPAGVNEMIIDVTAEVNEVKEEIMKYQTVTLLCKLKNVKGATLGTISEIIINNPKNISEEELKALQQWFDEMSQTLENKAEGNNDKEAGASEGSALPGSTGTGTIEMVIGSPLMTVNGVLKEIDPGRGTSPVLIQGRTFLPIKAVIEAIGGTVGWNGTVQKVTIQWKGKTLELWIGKKVMRLNGMDQTLDVAPYISDSGRTMLPLRFVGEGLGCQFNWEGVTQTITISYPLGNAPNT